MNFMIFFCHFRFRPFKGCIWPHGSQWHRYCCPIRWSHSGLFTNMELRKELSSYSFLLMCTIGVCTYIYRGGAIRSVLDSRDPGPPTHLFSTTPISSKTHSAPEMFFPEMFFLDIILSGIQILMLDFASMWLSRCYPHNLIPNLSFRKQDAIK